MVISTSSIKVQCCISNSPYMKKNCRYFKDKSGSEQTLLFGEKNDINNYNRI